MVLSNLGRATEVRELSAHKPISANGLTLMDLYDVAVEFGLSVEAYRFDPSELSAVKKGSILHFGGAHFVVFEKAGRGYVNVIDPATGRRRVSMDTFRSAVSGFLLQFSPTPEMPRIRAKSRVPAAMQRVRAVNPQLRAQIGKVLFVALGSQFTILAMPYFGNLVLDYVVAADNRNLLNVLVVTFASIFVFGALSEYVQKYLTELIFNLVQINSTEGLIGHLLRNPMPWFEKRHVGDVFARVKAQDEITGYATRSIVSLCIDVAVGTLALILMLIQSRQLTLIALVVFAAYVALALSMYPAMRDNHALVTETSARCDDALIETIRAASLLKLAQGETRRTSVYMTIFKAYAVAALAKSRLNCTRDSLLKLVNYADTVVLTYMAARLMLGGVVSVGVFYSFLIYKSLMSERFANAINAMFQYFMLSVPVARVDDIVEAQTETYTPLSASERATEIRDFSSIEMRNVTFSYGVSDKPVLADLNLSIRKGDKIVITGPSGSGKSTVFKLLSAAEPLREGHIELNGIAWPNLAVDEIRRHMAHMRQGDIILHGSIADNITLFAANPDDDRIHRLLSDVGLLDDVMRLPMRTRTVISDTIANISAGQRQRLLLARALYQQREILMLDEPTSNLDPASVKHIAQLLRSLKQTVVVITHDMALASAFDMRYAFANGGLVPEHVVQASDPVLVDA
nr:MULTISPECIES: ATP-binding cassette domain-containing protein [unclassified Caballeronia]